MPVTNEQIIERLASSGKTVTAVQRRPSPKRSSFAVEDLRATTSTGDTLDLILKDLSPSGLSDAGRAAKPPFLYDPHREIAMYRDVLTPETMGTPRCYVAVEEPERDEYWVLMEKVAGIELHETSGIEPWIAAARWAAIFHSSVQERPAPQGLIVYDADLYRLWLDRALAFNRSPELSHLRDTYDEVVDVLTSLPSTVIHGEFYPSNVMLRAGGAEICPIDWEMASWGPGWMDVAALTSGRWREADRTVVVAAYHDAMEGWGGGLPRTDPETVIDYCRLHIAVQWLGWAQDWSPPEQHAHDWKTEVASLTQRLAL